MGVWQKIKSDKQLSHSKPENREFSDQFPLRDTLAGNRSSCIDHFGMDISFDEYNN